MIIASIAGFTVSFLKMNICGEHESGEPVVGGSGLGLGSGPSTAANPPTVGASSPHGAGD